jgi:hypothetical protein
MGFRDRLEQKREEQTHAAQAQAEQTARAEATKKAVAQRDAAAMLPDMYEAVEALRADQERSARQLLSKGELGTRYTGIIGAMGSSTKERVEGPWYRRPTYRDRAEFAGWWIRYRSTDQAPFEFEVPLVGGPRVGRYTFNSSGPMSTLEDFANGGVHEYAVQVEETGPDETRVVTADEVFRNFLWVVEQHLLHLRP